MLAVKSQGLNFPGVKPWHIKASYILFDAKGKNPVNGVFEEWYVGPHRYKRSYTRPGFTQTDYGTDAGLYRSGEQSWAARDELQIPINLFEPLPDLQGTKDFTFEKADFTGDVKLRCIVLAHSTGANPVIGATFPTFCIDPETPVLRLSVPFGASMETIYNRTQVFQNHYLAGELIINMGAKRSLSWPSTRWSVCKTRTMQCSLRHQTPCSFRQGRLQLSVTSLQMLKSVAICVSGSGQSATRRWCCQDPVHNRPQWSCCKGENHRWSSHDATSLSRCGEPMDLSSVPA